MLARHRNEVSNKQAGMGKDNNQIGTTCVYRRNLLNYIRTVATFMVANTIVYN